MRIKTLRPTKDKRSHLVFAILDKQSEKEHCFVTKSLSVLDTSQDLTYISTTATNTPVGKTSTG